MASVNRILSPLYKARPWLPTFVVLLLSVALWAAVGLGPYSGYNCTPEFGDFEAQRHWMELTYYLPIDEWYMYKPQWWKLDYPPLTAYHSYVFGVIGTYLLPEAFELSTSEGIEGEYIKSYMRATVIVSQLLLFVPAVYSWCSMFNTNTPTKLNRTCSFLSVLLLPSLLLIDHGHFQFNSVMLGLFTSSLYYLMNSNFVFASFYFVLTLFFKQMSLYYAPAIFAAILGSCIGPAVNFKFNFKRFLGVSVTVLGTAACLLYPFIFDIDQLLQIFTRVFPVSRGLWEDKVSNFWCTLNYVGFKIHDHFEESQLPLLSLAATVIGIMPSMFAAFLGNKSVWPLCFASCSWSFYMFSFQVHEKSVLLPIFASALVATQYYSNRNINAMTRWAFNVSYFSLWPLLRREGLQLQFVIIYLIYNYLFFTGIPDHWFNKLVVFTSYLGFGVVFLLENSNLVSEAVRSRYPDLFVVGNMLMSFVSLMYFWVWQNWIILCLSKSSFTPVPEKSSLPEKTTNAPKSKQSRNSDRKNKLKVE
ncbi:dolichyl-P-Glc:Man(9)GlcNAc(2)-PP-dolichol alpha-1,3-glucosyltransferase [Starmerella bacillaris]|uniref:Alpha-1,3-glucosyltransferase n=1 Tax=Starmerella bacillaris TaxID=1247836 RepID=A0AAV5RDY8_STABA|nr:dolichyl-P-Glc:Man(9)GlcNAc(2)-PP-dolichol alpha-1,3-glucosyltransferase [Starmerella bacillaris]